jgi:hypothetical protein
LCVQRDVGSSGTLCEDAADDRVDRSLADWQDLYHPAPVFTLRIRVFDLPTEAEQAEKEPQRFFQRNPPPVIIDEVQYAPGLFRHLKVAVDAQRKRNGQFLLTGSQKFTRMRNVSESLAGRADIVELETLSFAEIREALPKTGLETVISAVVSRNCMPTWISTR